MSGLSVGEHQFTVTVSDGVDAMELGVSVTVTAQEVTVQPEVEAKSSSSGSLAWLTLLMAGFAGLRRRKAKRS
ncbi:PEP-CTERM protein-sorting domain-containing protein/GlyGly-CTERM domain-containing protein/MYXO-CTERM domain-containing protein [Pseudoalteromonas lipolytica]|uniref:PEP-CTERM protein-sorting domain-containing protein/GlyGly-CTERM domain-containing protein/MYXO-CTERM domain-containing protein n=1 Tax=Pseudoalteromonas lipolytica TaxID=570156 RepID=A0ABY1GUM8_9GAMM|nr:PEP-CTERM protein-sorting domain-containing protein/GlyGly-CTERM domain-containing protein/MYXO-CTERM domain-containing protein [Pseudoalteromonas lipolytica]